MSGKFSDGENKLFEIEEVQHYLREAVSLGWKMAIQRPPLTFASLEENTAWEESLTQNYELAWGSVVKPDAVVQYMHYPMLTHGGKLMSKGKAYVNDVSNPPTEKKDETETVKTGNPTDGEEKTAQLQSPSEETQKVAEKEENMETTQSQTQQKATKAARNEEEEDENEPDRKRSREDDSTRGSEEVIETKISRL